MLAPSGESARYLAPRPPTKRLTSTPAARSTTDTSLLTRLATDRTRPGRSASTAVGSNPAGRLRTTPGSILHQAVGRVREPAGGIREHGVRFEPRGQAAYHHERRGIDLRNRIAPRIRHIQARSIRGQRSEERRVGKEGR